MDFEEWVHLDGDRASFKRRKRELLAFGIRTKDMPNRHLRAYFTTRRYDQSGYKLAISLFNHDPVNDPKDKNLDRAEVLVDCSHLPGPLRYANMKMFRDVHTVVIQGARFVDKCALHIKARNIRFVDCIWETAKAAVIHKEETKIKVRGTTAGEEVRFRCFKNLPGMRGGLLGGVGALGGLLGGDDTSREGLLARLALLKALSGAMHSQHQT
jgi:hypothetical protein